MMYTHTNHSACHPCLAAPGDIQPWFAAPLAPFDDGRYSILISHLWENDSEASRPEMVVVSLYFAETMEDTFEYVGSYELTAQDNWRQVATVSNYGYYYARATVAGYTTTDSDTIFVPAAGTSDYDGLQWEAPNANNPFGSANYFSAFVFGDVSVQGAEVESGLAARGSFSSAAGFTAGLPWANTNGHSFVGLPIAPHDPRFLVGGNITAVQNLDVFGGSIVLADDASFPTDVPITQWRYTGENEFYSELDRADFEATRVPYSITRATRARINQFFTDAENGLTALSQSYANLAAGERVYVAEVPNGAWRGTSYYDLYLTEILPSDFNYASYDTIVFNAAIPATVAGESAWASTVLNFPETFTGRYILNILPGLTVTTLHIVAGSTIINGVNRMLDPYGNDTVWELARRYSDRMVLNFPDASLATITTSGNEIVGSVLAPLSDFLPSGGAVNGTLVARSITATGGFEVHATTHFGRIRPSATYDGELILVSTPSDAPSTVSVSLTASKSAVGAPLPADYFTFGAFEGDRLVSAGTNDASGNVLFAPIAYTEPGEHTYIIREISPAGGNWTVDTRTFTANVSIFAGTETGALVVQLSYPEGTPTFVNAYTGGTPTDRVVVFKELIGWERAEIPFTFGLFDADGVQVSTAQSVVGVATFPAIAFTAAGVYNYTVREIAGGGNGWTADSRVFPVTITVEAITGVEQFATTVTYPQGQPVFINVYEAAPARVRLRARKRALGAVPQAGRFLFALYDERGALVSTGTNERDGSIRFPALTLDAAGIYRYTMRELRAVEHWRMDANGFPVVITVVDDGLGRLIATTDYPLGIPEFVNNYCPCPKTKLRLKARKCVQGAPMQAGQFRFVLCDACGREMAQATNTQSGDIAFPALTFTQAGVFHYTIREVQDCAAGWRYDTRVFPVTVSVCFDCDVLSAKVCHERGFPQFVNVFVGCC